MKIVLCTDNSTLLDSISDHLKKITCSPDFTLLKTQVLILCRETFSEDYLYMKLSERGIPSLAYEIRSMKDFMRDVLEKTDPKTETAGRLEELFLLQKVISENGKFKERNLPLSALFHIASDIYDIFEKHRKSGKAIPENWKYADIWKEYRKKKTKLSPSEKMLKFLDSASRKKNPADLLSEYTHLFLAGHYHIDPVQKKFAEHLSSLMKAKNSEPRAFICRSRNILIDPEDERNSETGYLLKEFPGAETEFFGKDKSFRAFFFSAPEIFRELETVGRRILKILHDKRNLPAFRLTDIKIIIPDVPAYHLGIKNVLESLNLSFSFTNNLFGKKLSPYYTAVSALLDLTDSEFLPEKALALFRNPCFAPSVSGSRIVPDIYAWQNILNSSRITGFLDEIERQEKGHRNDRRFTWEHLWDRLASQDIADSAETSDFLSDSEDFIMITSSLFHDLISLKNSEGPEFFADLFERILEIYLDPEMPESETDSMQLARMNVTVHDRIISSLSEVRKLQQFSDPEDRIPYEMYRQIISDTLDSMQEGSSQVYKSGITVGTVKDTLDAEVSCLFCTGLDEDSFRSRADLDTYISVNPDNTEEEKDIHLTKLRYLSHCFSYGAEELYFSYTNYDTEKDRRRYPAPEYEIIRTKLSSIYGPNQFHEHKISLYPHEEYPASFPETLSEKEVFEMTVMKAWESETEFNTVSPSWEGRDLNLPEIFKDSEDTVRRMFSRNSGKKISRLGKRSAASPAEIANYIECPRKYVYTHIMNTASDYEPEEENYSLNPLIRMNILNSVVQKFVKNPGLEIRNLQDDSVLFSELPMGLAGQA
ncbi:MAG TPA: exodeoxyribonuclease V subunit gamma, partial [Leptospiraceae bacterium]|nr:exodeoxyribonuclease V subunit gamma [Leptospiraceae bacterium]